MLVKRVKRFLDWRSVIVQPLANFSDGFFDRLTIFIKFRLLLLDDFLLRELLIFDLGIVKDGFLVIGERNNGSHFTERLLN
jgi:hypothetical protein